MSKILVIDSCWKCSNKDIAIEDYSEYTCLLLNKKLSDDKITKEILKDCPLKDAYEEHEKEIRSLELQIEQLKKEKENE